ncbi:hypothetical protein EC396_03735 [Lutibacter sp. HS1-25]|uniref:hypothetical protein n=1 Tax=Lutibacter sp. HS1-25 TaxID=2485000 RepID=UPI0010118558|nr:hypothetical protein [Lutibacter sp. HS1-25]RXP61930.1 hypothetical protein EC396_03735 [Lutibacter sp. HS1-25]
MKIVALFFLTIAFLTSNPTLDAVRKEFPNITSEAQADDFIAGLSNSNTAEAKGYIAAMNFMKSRFVGFPFTKLKYFKLGKNQLDEVIANNPKNLEMRYIRYLMQKQIPDFLGYHQNIDEDFKAIIAGFKKYDLATSLKIKIVSNMLLVDNLTETEKSELNKLKQNL